MMWKKRWFKKGILLAVLPLSAMGCHHRHRHAGHAESEAEVREHLEEHAEHLLDSVDASDRQVQEVNEILERLAPDLFAYQTEHESLRAAYQRVLSQERIDREQLEALRTKTVALVDRATRRGLDAVAEIADVLDAEQRKKLIGKWKRFRG